MKKFIFPIVLLTLFSCGHQQTHKKVAPPDPGFTSYIAGYTSGIISSASAIRILLTEDIPDVKPNSVAGDDLFSFKPPVKGEAYWVNPHTLEFRPAEPLPAGTVFQAVFHLGKVMQVPDKYKDFPFGFRTFHQGIRVNIGGMSSLSDRDLRWQQLSGRLLTADVAPAGKTEKILRAEQNGKPLKIKWTHNEQGTVHKFVIDSIRRTEKKGEVLISWDGSPIGAEEKGSRTVEIPALSDFKLMNIRTAVSDGQRIDLYFSDPVSTSQSLNGLIRFEDGPEVRLERKGNIIHVYPRRSISKTKTLVVEPTIRNVQGYRLGKRYTRDISFTGIKPAVEILGKGVILPSTQGLTLPFRAVNLKAVNVKVVKVYEKNIPQFLQVNPFDGDRELKRVGRLIIKKEIRLVSDKPIDYSSWNVFSLDLSSLIRSEPGALYRVTISFNRSQSLYPCSGNGSNTTKTLAGSTPDDEYSIYDGPNSGDYHYGYYDDWDPSWNYDNYHWKERDNPCSDSYYMFNNRSATRNVLASDLGIIVKGGDDHRLLVTVTNLPDASPLGGVQVEVYDYQHQLMAAERTDSKGIAEIALSRKPFLVVAVKDNQKGYLRVDDGSALTVSMFDVAGMKAPKGIKGFLYGERDIWRPGDSLYLTFILEDRNHTLPAGHPVILEVYTPESRLYLRKVRTSSLNGVYDFRMKTEGDAPTGPWQARVRVGDMVFSRTLRIETVKPNRLKIKLDFGKELLTAGSDNRCTLSATWLHGAIARNLKADVNLSLAPAHAAFKEYKDYSFEDPSKTFYGEEEPVFEGRLNNEGKASFLPNIHVGKDAPGMLRATFRTRVFEPSGDFSVDRYSILYSPFKSYAGVKIPEGPGWNGALYSNETNLIPIVTVDEQGRPVDRTVKIEIYNISWRWWWDRSSYDDLADYVRRKSRNLIRTDKITTHNGKALYEMKFKEEQWGRRLIRVIDPVSGHSCGKIFYLTYKGWWSDNTQEGPGGAEILMFTTDKKSYNVGDKIRVQLPSFSEGRALITVENGSKILQHFWKEGGGDSLVVLEATPEMAPNAYICIELIQPHSRTTNDRPIRMYGIRPVSVTDPLTRLSPEILMPEKLEPEGEAVIRVKEKEGRAMTYTLAIVDEGLLDLTRFRTPDPWKYFYAREALGIRTWDMYKYVLGAFSGRIAGIVSIGGDMYLEKTGKKNTNRFKPVVLFLGPYTLKRGKTAAHTIRMPNYVGSVRAMVVAADGNGAYGHTEKTVPVKKPLMVLATLPRVVSPGEQVTLPVSVFAMEKNIRRVTVKVSVEGPFSLGGSNTQTLTFDQTGDQLVFFDLKVADRPGAGKIEVTASAGGQEAHDLIRLQVRAPNPRITRVTGAAAEGGATWRGRYEAVGMAGTNEGTLEVSSLPPLRLEERLEYLLTYPHGCAEQVTSTAFAQLYLDRLTQPGEQQQDEIQQNITAAINKLVTFQTAGGGLTYWPGSSFSPDEWVTSYAGHFLLEARSRGYEVPAAFLDSWLRYQRRTADNWARAEKKRWWHSSELIQAYRLYTLALAGKPATGAMNRMREMSSLAPAARWRLAGAYLLAGRDEAARTLVQGLTTRISPYRELSYTYGSALRDEAMILEVITLMHDKVQGKKIVDMLSEQLNSSRWYSTQSTAWALLAIAKFVGEEGTSSHPQFVCRINGKKLRYKGKSPVATFPLPFGRDGKGGEITVENSGGKTLFINVTVSGLPLAGREEAVNSGNLIMNISYADMQGRKIYPARLEQGTDFYVEVSLHNTGLLGNYKEMALTQLFPSGWEIRNVRLDNSEYMMRDKPRYQDIRDDRVYTYFDLRSNETKTFRVLLNATYLGRFYLPAVKCEAMYDHSIIATQPGKWVEVIKQR